jgi:hypothetical protein
VIKNQTSLSACIVLGGIILSVFGWIHPNPAVLHILSTPSFLFNSARLVRTARNTPSPNSPENTEANGENNKSESSSVPIVKAMGRTKTFRTSGHTEGEGP